MQKQPLPGAGVRPRVQLQGCPDSGHAARAAVSSWSWLLQRSTSCAHRTEAQPCPQGREVALSPGSGEARGGEQGGLGAEAGAAQRTSSAEKPLPLPSRSEFAAGSPRSLSSPVCCRLLVSGCPAAHHPLDGRLGRLSLSGSSWRPLAHNPQADPFPDRTPFFKTPPLPLQSEGLGRHKTQRPPPPESVWGRAQRPCPALAFAPALPDSLEIGGRVGRWHHAPPGPAPVHAGALRGQQAALQERSGDRGGPSPRRDPQSLQPLQEPLLAGRCACREGWAASGVPRQRLGLGKPCTASLRFQPLSHASGAVPLKQPEQPLRLGRGGTRGPRRRPGVGASPRDPARGCPHHFSPDLRSRVGLRPSIPRLRACACKDACACVSMCVKYTCVLWVCSTCA